MTRPARGVAERDRVEPAGKIEFPASGFKASPITSGGSKVSSLYSKSPGSRASGALVARQDCLTHFLDRRELQVDGRDEQSLTRSERAHARRTGSWSGGLGVQGGDADEAVHSQTVRRGVARPPSLGGVQPLTRADTSTRWRVRSSGTWETSRQP
jgi:hypothetical protein